MAHMYYRERPRYIADLEPCSPTFFIEDSWITADRMNEFEQVLASEEEVESFIIRVSEGGVPYRQPVNWCARSTFYTEKAAWKEFDRKNPAIVHTSAYDALPCPPGSYQGQTVRRVDTTQQHTNYHPLRAAPLPPVPTNNAGPHVDPHVAFEDENVATMETWIQAMNTKAGMSAQEAAESGHLLGHALMGHGAALTNRPCSVCGKQSLQECPGGCANWLCPVCAPHYTRCCLSCATVLPHAAYESQLSVASTQHHAPHTDPRKFAEKGQPAVQQLTHSKIDMSYSNYEKQPVPLASPSHLQSSRALQPDHLAGMSDQEKAVMQQDWPPQLAGHSHMVRSPVTTTIVAAVTTSVAPGVVPTVPSTIAPAAVPSQLLKLDAKAQAFGLDPVNSPSVSTRIPRRQAGVSFQDVQSPQHDAVLGVRGTEGGAGVQFEDPYGARVTDFTDGSPVVLPGHQTGGDAAKHSIQWAEETGEVKMIIPDLDQQFSPRPSIPEQTGAGASPPPPAISRVSNIHRPPSITEGHSIHRPPSLTDRQQDAFIRSSSLTTVHQPTLSAQQTDRLSPSPSPAVQALGQVSLKTRAERHTKDWFAPATPPSPPLDNPMMTAWTLPPSQAESMDSKYHAQQPSVEHRGTNDPRDTATAASSSHHHNARVHQPQIEPECEPEPEPLQLDDLQVDSPVASPETGGRSDPPPSLPSYWGDISQPAPLPASVGPSLFFSPATSSSWRPAPLSPSPPPRARDIDVRSEEAPAPAPLPPPRIKDFGALEGLSPPPPARHFPDPSRSVLDEAMPPLPRREARGASHPPRSIALNPTTMGSTKETSKQMNEDAPIFLLDRKSAPAHKETPSFLLDRKSVPAHKETPSFLLDRKSVPASRDIEEKNDAASNSASRRDDSGWESKLLLEKEKDSMQEAMESKETNWRSRLKRLSQSLEPEESAPEQLTSQDIPKSGEKTGGRDPNLPRELPASPQRLASLNKVSLRKTQFQHKAAEIGDGEATAGAGSVRAMIQKMQGGDGGANFPPKPKPKPQPASEGRAASASSQAQSSLRSESGGSDASRAASSDRLAMRVSQQQSEGEDVVPPPNGGLSVSKRPTDAAPQSSSRASEETPSDAAKTQKKRGFLSSLLGRGGKDSKA